NTSSLGPGKAPLDVNQVSLLIIYVERMWLAHPFLTGACSKDCRIAAQLPPLWSCCRGLINDEMDSFDTGSRKASVAVVHAP
ncbi:MAG: hypothetical protein ABJI96_18065, partial [Paracoccaceae bacterium]